MGAWSLSGCHIHLPEIASASSWRRRFLDFGFRLWGVVMACVGLGSSA